MNAPKEYAADAAEFQKLDALSAKGDRAAQSQKNIVAQRMRQAESEAADEGVILSPKTGRAESEGGPKKRDLQGEYCRSFAKGYSSVADEPIAIVKDRAHPEGREIRLSEWHRERLLGGK